MLPAVYEVRRKQLEHEQVDDTVSFQKRYVRYDFFKVNAFLVPNVWEVCTVKQQENEQVPDAVSIKKW